MRSYYEYSLSDDAKPCPFCEIDRPLIVESSKKFIVTLARAPYTKDHLLIIPKKHKILFSKLKSKEIKELFSLVKKRDKKLHTMYEDVTFLLRDGYINLGKSNKSVNHFHFHLIPKIPIGALNNINDRPFLDEEDFILLVDDFCKRTK